MSKRKEDLVKIIYHPRYSDDYITASCETPSRVMNIMQTLGDQFTVVKPEPCTEKDILLCHSEGLILSEKMDFKRFETACLSVGGAIMASEIALDGVLPFAAIRPPGHHANPDHNWGFCFFNNMGIAVSKLLAEKKITSAAILDIDLHFGDGTESIFKNNNAVTVINIQSPIPEAFIQETMEELKLIKKADIIGISAGFDQYVKDWGGNLSTEDYHAIGVLAGNCARSLCQGKIFAILEGGYYIPDLGRNALSLINGMLEGRR